MSDVASTPHRRISGEEVAKKMGVSVEAVRIYRSNDQNKEPGPHRFPKPVGYNGRIVLFDEAEIDAYIVARSTHNLGKRGRRPLTTPEQLQTATFADRVREAIRNGDGLPDIPTQNALAELLGLNSITFGQRMRGRTSWKPSELETIASVLQLDTHDANDAVDAMRAARKASRGSATS